MKPKVANFLKNLGLFLATFAICFILLEVALRIAGYGKVELYEPHAKLFWRLKPNQDRLTKIGRKPVHVNSHGTRGPEFDEKKAPGTIRILFLGDSKTFGWGLSEEETFASLTGRLLGEKAGTNKVEIINAGVNAWGYAQMLIYFKEYGRKYDVDYVIIGDANLWTQFSEQSNPEFVKSFLSRVRLKNFLRRFATYHYIVEVQLEQVYQKYRTRFIPVNPEQDQLFKDQQQKDPFAFFDKAITDLCAETRSAGAKPVLLFIPIQSDIGTTNQTIGEVKSRISKALNVPLVDCTPVIAPRKDQLYLPADPVHLNEEGNRLVAQELFKTLQPLLP